MDTRAVLNLAPLTSRNQQKTAKEWQKTLSFLSPPSLAGEPLIIWYSGRPLTIKVQDHSQSRFRAVVADLTQS